MYVFKTQIYIIYNIIPFLNSKNTNDNQKFLLKYLKIITSYKFYNSDLRLITISAISLS